jgi:hypothetical protein
MRPILPNLFFESIYLGVVSSVHFRGWRAEVEHHAPECSIVRGGKQRYVRP